MGGGELNDVNAKNKNHFKGPFWSGLHHDRAGPLSHRYAEMQSHSINPSADSPSSSSDSFHRAV